MDQGTVGWAVGPNMKTELPLAAPGWMHHSDQGSQGAYQTLSQIRDSMLARWNSGEIGGGRRGFERRIRVRGVTKKEPSLAPMVFI